MPFIGDINTIIGSKCIPWQIQITIFNKIKKNIFLVLATLPLLFYMFCRKIDPEELVKKIHTHSVVVTLVLKLLIEEVGPLWQMWRLGHLAKCGIVSKFVSQSPMLIFYNYCRCVFCLG